MRERYIKGAFYIAFYLKKRGTWWWIAVAKPINQCLKIPSVSQIGSKHLLGVYLVRDKFVAQYAEGTMVIIPFNYKVMADD